MDYSLIVKKWRPYITPNAVLNINMHIIDGEIVYMLSTEVWNNIKKVSDCQGYLTITLPDYLCEILEKKIEFARKNIGFSTIIYDGLYRGTKVSFLTDTVYYFDGQWNRVAIENTLCNHCRWRGLIANPTIPGLFDLVKNRDEALQKAASLSQVGCPQCKRFLSNYAIWTSR